MKQYLCHVWDLKKNVTIYTSSKCKNLDQILESVGGEHGNYCTLHTLWELSEWVEKQFRILYENNISALKSLVCVCV